MIRYKIVSYLFFLLIISKLSAQGAFLPNKATSSSISNYYVSAITEDPYGYIWIGTLRGLNRYNGSTYTQYFASSDDTTSLRGNQVLSLFTDRTGRVWVGTTQGVCRYNIDDTFTYVRTPQEAPNVAAFFQTADGVLYGASYTALVRYDDSTGCFETVAAIDAFSSVSQMDSEERFWFFFSNTALCLDAQGNEAARLTLPCQVVYSALAFQSYIVVATDAGVFRISLLSLSVEPWPVTATHPDLHLEKVKQFYPYRGGYLLSTTDHGLFYYHASTGVLFNQRESSFPFVASEADYTCFFSDSHNNLWMGSYDKGVFIDNRAERLFNSGRTTLTHLFASKNVIAIKVFGRDIMLATRKDGVYAFDTDTYIARPLAITPALSSEYSLSAMEVGPDGTLWLAHQNGIMEYARRGDTYVLRHQYKMTAEIHVLFCDSKGTLWVGALDHRAYYLPQGAQVFSTLQYANATGYHFINDIIELSTGEIVLAPFKSGLLVVDNATKMIVREIAVNRYGAAEVFLPGSVVEDTAGDLWIGTTFSGVLHYDPRMDSAVVYSRRDGLSSDMVSMVVEDGKGDIWVSTLNGLSLFDRTTKTFMSWNAESGTGGNQFNHNAGALTPNKLVIFGGTHGVTYFNPVIISSPRTYPIHIETLVIRNAKPEHNEEPIDKEIQVLHKHRVVLEHGQNEISLQYAALVFSDYAQVRYKYKMDGWDSDWIRAGSNNMATYSQLPAGTYTFRVTIDNLDATPSEEATLELVIPKPFWKRWYMKGAYILIGLVLLTYIRSQLRKREMDKEAYNQLKIQREKDLQQGASNMEFFTTISHEFRTPLTIISGPLAQLQEKADLDDESHYLLAIIQRSVNRMMQLIGQILDFRKIESGVMQLKVVKSDVIAELQKIVELFTFNFKEKGVNLTTKGVIDTYLTWLDTDRFNKMVGNLVSNSLKYTPQGGEVCIEFDVITRDECQQMFPKAEVSSVDTDYICIKIFDTGPGYEPDVLPLLFTRYFVTGSQAAKISWSSGVGLYYTYKLVTYHHGFIKAENRPRGGSLTTFALPVADCFFPEHERVSLQVKEDVMVKDKLEQLEQTFHSVPEEEALEGRKSILVVDDDTEICYYLKLLLSKEYNVTTKLSATAAYKELDSLYPDLIISDVLMPQMNGYEFCKLIKDNPTFSHAPVILLTAKAAMDNQVEGLKTGADAYVTKPFEPKYLLALIHSLLSNREKMQRSFKEHTSLEEAESDSLSTLDKHFMDTLYKTMERELSNPEVNVTQLATELNLSRTKLYYKIKGLTGENPNAFFNRYKLNRAAEMLLQGGYNVSDVADMTGFKTVSHFSTLFKKQFGMTPTQYAKNK